MANIDRWGKLDDLTKDFKGFSNISPSLMSALVEHMEEAIAASSREPSAVLSDQLSALFVRLVQAAPERTSKAVRGELPDSAEHAAYVIGQIEYAQMFSAQIANHMVSDTFMHVLGDARYKPLVRALHERDELSNTRLAETIGESAETVSRKLALLREEGICYFRQEGTTRINFLTPAATAAYSERQSETAASVTAVAPSPEATAYLSRFARGGLFDKAANFSGADVANVPTHLSVTVAQAGYQVSA